MQGSTVFGGLLDISSNTLINFGQLLTSLRSKDEGKEEDGRGAEYIHTISIRGTLEVEPSVACLLHVQTNHSCLSIRFWKLRME